MKSEYLQLCLTALLWPTIVGASFFGCRTSDLARRVLVAKFMLSNGSTAPSKKGRLLVMGGTGFLGQAVCKRAALNGYSVTSLSRRGRPSAGDPSPSSSNIKHIAGDARDISTIVDILNQGDFAGIIHCVGLLLDEQSGLGRYNRFASGSGSIPGSGSTYDAVTRVTAFNAMDAATAYAETNGLEELFPFCFTSAAEAGWPDMPGGSFVENNLAPDFLKRYLLAKRAVEERLLGSERLRPIIVRPSLIYTMDKPESLPSVGAFFLGNKLGLPFVDQPVTVQSLANAMVRSISQQEVTGILRFQQINVMNE